MRLRPLALRAESVVECWGSILLHALYFTPQIRAQIASMTFLEVDNPFVLSPKERRESKLYIVECNLKVSRFLCDATVLHSHDLRSNVILAHEKRNL